MFKKLRNKFLLINMIITSIVMFMAFFVIYITTYNNIKNENEKKLNDISTSYISAYATSPFNNIIIPHNVYIDENYNTIVPYMKPIDDKSIIIFDESYINDNKNTDSLDNIGISITMNKNNIYENIDYSLSFIAEVDENYSIVNIESFIGLSEENYKTAINLATKQNKNIGNINLNNKIWQYSKYPLINHSFEKVLNNLSIGKSFKTYKIAFLDISDSIKTLKDLLITFLFTGIFLLIVIFFISLYFSNSSIKPILNTWNMQKQFIADASHELKTPISIINANYDVLLANKEDTIENQIKWLEYIKIGSERMENLTSSLLYLAKAEDINNKIEKELFNISDETKNVLLSMEAYAINKNLTIKHNITTDIFFSTDKNLYKQVVTILYDNAIKFSPEYGKIEIFLLKKKNNIIFSIKNNGEGIDEIDLEKIFERFFRTDKSRHSKTGGYGLGLPIAKSIVNKLGGEICAKSKKNEWTLFKVTL